MKLIDADALRERLDELYRTSRVVGSSDEYRWGISAGTQMIDAAPSIACAADNPHGLVPSKCPTCGEELVPYPCMDLALDSYRDGILYGQGHPEWRADG